jgi:hypothetical protein
MGREKLRITKMLSLLADAEGGHNLYYSQEKESSERKTYYGIMFKCDEKGA